jgi:hypothetical protein
MEEVKKVEDGSPFSVINGADVKVGHCNKRYCCSISICTGTDCKEYSKTNKNI